MPFEEIKKLIKSHGGKYVKVRYGVNAGGIRVRLYISAHWHFSGKIPWQDQKKSIKVLTKALEKEGWKMDGWKTVIGYFLSGHKKVLYEA